MEELISFHCLCTLYWVLLCKAGSASSDKVMPGLRGSGGEYNTDTGTYGIGLKAVNIN
jgi:hypothetical protein